MLGYLWRYFTSWDWRLFLFILLYIGLPNVYQLYRIYLIGNELPDPGSLAIVSQWQFVGLIVEVFQEATVLAIFFFLGSQIRSGTALQFDRAKSVLTFIFLTSLLFSVAVFLFRDSFIAPSVPHPVSRAKLGNFWAFPFLVSHLPCWPLP